MEKLLAYLGTGKWSDRDRKVWEGELTEQHSGGECQAKELGPDPEGCGASNWSLRPLGNLRYVPGMWFHRDFHNFVIPFQ